MESRVFLDNKRPGRRHDEWMAPSLTTTVAALRLVTTLCVFYIGLVADEAHAFPLACVPLPDSADWCKDILPELCDVDGTVGRAIRGACPTKCNSCEAASAEALDKVLQEGGTVEYRTGFVLPDPRLVSTSKEAEKGWELWLQKSGALTTGIPVGAGHVRINHTTVLAPSTPDDCGAYYRAAKDLVDYHKANKLLRP